MEIRELKESYMKVAGNYGLPGFEQVNEIFEIEKIEHESECLPRAIRKAMLEKVFNTLAFLEMLLNPVNAPRMYLSYVKQMSVNDKQLIEKLYGELGGLSLQALPLEVEYNEKSEAEMILDIYKTWNSLRPDLKKLMNIIGMPIENLSKKERTYFG